MRPSPLIKEKMWQRLHENPQVDILIIGGGATGMGAAVEAASRGYKTLLVEQSDFGKGTSGKSTKLIHGGVRYLQQGNIALVLEALKERGILHRNAPHLVHDLPFVIPVYDWWEGPFYGIGLRLYDWMAGKEGFGPSRNLTVEETIKRIPTVEQKGLRGGVIYHDGQFDDARLLINLATTAVEQGAAVLNYMRVEEVIKENKIITGVKVRDMESGQVYTLAGKVVINAAGVGVDAVRRMDNPHIQPMIAASRGTHIVLKRSFLPGNSAIMVPHTDDGRVLFAIPWNNAILIGTTDIAEPSSTLEPRPTAEEIRFLLRHAARYLEKDPEVSDVRSVFTGLRPLVQGEKSGDTAAISREHVVHISSAGLVTIAGGKWTTYRKMAEDVINTAADLAGLPEHPSVTRELPIHGAGPIDSDTDPFAHYGTDAAVIQRIMEAEPKMEKPLINGCSLTAAEVAFFVRHEMARTVEDVLSRRSRFLLLNASLAGQLAQPVAQIMAVELNQSPQWMASQIEQFHSLLTGYQAQNIIESEEGMR